LKPDVLLFATIELITVAAVARRRLMPDVAPGNVAPERVRSPMIVKFEIVGFERPAHTNCVNGAISLLSASMPLSPF
jgi:hypothetical protein